MEPEGPGAAPKQQIQFLAEVAEGTLSKKACGARSHEQLTPVLL
jgi:hypothetical protein